MYVSARLDHALRALALLPAERGERPVTATHLAEHQDVSIGYLCKILNDLCLAGLVVHTRGHSGGYSLARPAARISVGDVLSALRISPVEVPTTPRAGDEVAGRLLALWRRVDDAAQDVLRSVTIEDVLADPRPSPKLSSALSVRQMADL